MSSIYDVPANDLIAKVTEELKKNNKIKPPVWSVFAKTGVHKERPPINPEWWYVRCAAVLRKLSIRGPIGVSKLRSQYGGNKNRGMKPERFRKGSGSVARKVLQQLEAAGYARQVQRAGHKGRVITPIGQSVLDKAAS